MKKIFITFITLFTLITGTAIAGLPITKVDRVNPTDEIFIDMALSAAKSNVEQGGLPCGAVVILNGALRSSGKATATATAEENAIVSSRKKKLNMATIFTINEPTTEAYNAICRSGADAVVFVNSREDVIAKGVYPAEAYNDALIDSTLTKVPLHQMDFRDASTFLKNYKK